MKDFAMGVLCILAFVVSTTFAQVSIIPSGGGGSATTPVQFFTLCSGGNFVAAANTTEQVLATCLVPANRMGTNGWIQVHHWWEFKTPGGDASPGTKAVRMKWGAADAQLMGSNANGTFFGSLLHLINTSATTQFSTGDNGAYGSGGNFGGFPRFTVDTTVNQNIKLTCQKETAVENCTLVHYAVQLVVP